MQRPHLPSQPSPFLTDKHRVLVTVTIIRRIYLHSNQIRRTKLLHLRRMSGFKVVGLILSVCPIVLSAWTPIKPPCRHSPPVPSPDHRSHMSPLPPASRSSQSIRRQYPVDKPTSNASNYAERATADSFFETSSNPNEALPVPEPRLSSAKNADLKHLKDKFTAKELEKQFSLELSRLDRHRGPDLKSSMLSALFRTLPVLALYYIRSLPFRLLAVILLNLVFAIGLSLTYRRNREKCLQPLQRET